MSELTVAPLCFVPLHLVYQVSLLFVEGISRRLHCPRSVLVEFFVALQLLLERLHLLSELTVFLLKILSHAKARLVLLLRFIDRLVHLFEYDSVRLALFLLSFLAVD